MNRDQHTEELIEGWDPPELDKINANGHANGKAQLTGVELYQLGFDITATGSIKTSCENARHAVKLMGINCEYDQFHDKLIIGGQPIGQYAGELSDHACLVLRKMARTTKQGLAMFVIATKFEGETRRVDLHEVRVPGGALAKDLPGPDLYRAMVKLKVPGVSPSHGWQDLCFRLGVFIQRQDEKAAAGTPA